MRFSVHKTLYDVNCRIKLVFTWQHCFAFLEIWRKTRYRNGFAVTGNPFVPINNVLTQIFYCELFAKIPVWFCCYGNFCSVLPLQKTGAIMLLRKFQWSSLLYFLHTNSISARKNLYDINDWTKLVFMR